MCFHVSFGEISVWKESRAFDFLIQENANKGVKVVIEKNSLEEGWYLHLFSLNLPACDLIMIKA